MFRRRSLRWETEKKTKLQKKFIDAAELTAISGAVVPLPVDLVSVAVHLGAAPEALGVLLGARLKVLALVGEGEHAVQPSVRSATSGYRG